MTKKPETTLPALIKTAKLTTEDAKRIQEQYKEIQAISKDWIKKAKLFVITEPTQVADMASCKAGYEFLRTKFNEIESLRKNLKEEALRKGQAIDAIAKRFKALIEPTMNDLKAKSEFAKTYNENFIKEKGEKRLKILSEFDVFMSVEDAANMLDDVFDNYVEIAKKNYYDRKNSEPAIVESTQPLAEPMIGVHVTFEGTSGDVKKVEEVKQMIGVPLTDKEEMALVLHLLSNINLPDVEEENAIEVMKGVEQDIMDAISRIKRYLDGTN